MSGVNKVELKIIDWLKVERGRDSKVWPFLWDVAQGDESEWGDDQLGACLSDLLNGSASAELLLEDLGADLGVTYDLIRELEGPDQVTDWLADLDAMVIRVLLMQIHRNDDLYVHSLVKGFHPKNRYRVDDESFVYEQGWTSASGRWGLAAADRQICDEPIGGPCSCRIEQRERGQ